MIPNCNDTKEVRKLTLLTNSYYLKIPLSLYNNKISYVFFSNLGPCEIMNGGCEHVCLPSAAKATCKCDFGFHLDPDNKNCSSG